MLKRIIGLRTRRLQAMRDKNSNKRICALQLEGEG